MRTSCHLLVAAGGAYAQLWAVQTGDLAVGSTINWSPQVKELNLFSLPFLMPDYAAIDVFTCQARSWRPGGIPDDYGRGASSGRPPPHELPEP